MTRIVFVGQKDSQQNLLARSVMQKLIQEYGLTEEFQIETAFLGDSAVDVSSFLQNRDYDRYDLLIGMVQQDLWEMYRICGGDFSDKMLLFRDYIHSLGNSSSNESGLTTEQIQEGCQGLLRWLKKRFFECGLILSFD